MIDFNQLASLTPDQAIALIKQQYGSGSGGIDWRSTIAGGGDPYAVLSDASGNVYDWNQATRPEMTEGGSNGWNLDNAKFDRALTTTGTSAVDPTQYGHYKGVYDSKGNLVNVEWVQEDKSSGFFMDNLETIGPLIVGGAMAAGAGGFLPDFSQGASISGPVGTTDLLGGTMVDTLGAEAGGGLLDYGAFGIDNIPVVGGDAAMNAAIADATAAGAIGADAGGAALSAIDQIPVVGGQAATDAAIAASTAAGASGVIPNVAQAIKDSGVLPLVTATAAGVSAGNEKGGTTTTTKAPWEPTQETLKAIIAQAPSLLDYFTQNPFNDQQKAGYSNLFSDLGNFRENIAPGLFGFANDAMSNQYTRAPRVDPASYAMPTIQMPFGPKVTSAAPTVTTQPTTTSAAQKYRPFSVVPGASYGPIDWTKNPFSSGVIPSVSSYRKV